MSPKEFIRILDAWIDRRGPLNFEIPESFSITTTSEAAALAKALRQGDVFAGRVLHNLIVLVQRASTSHAVSQALREQALPPLREAIEKLLSGTAGDQDDLLFALKVVASFGEPRDGPLIVRCARVPALKDAYIWEVVFAIVSRRSDAVAICEALKQPLPEGFAGVTYLDFANTLARQGLLQMHPFDTSAGAERLSGYFSNIDADDVSYGISAINAAPFVSAELQHELFRLADEIASNAFRVEAAWARAKAGQEQGRRALVELASTPQWSTKAVAYLDELGFAKLVPPAVRGPEFAALSEMSQWLAHPSEFGVPPDRVSIFDTRRLSWPPTNDQRTLWLVRYEFGPSAHRDQAESGVGLVGGISTFALFDEATVDLSAEDLYGLYCCFELELNGDRRAPKQRSAAMGRMILAKKNKGF